MGQRKPPHFVQITRWERAIPQYVPGHGARLAQVEERLAALPGLFLTGNACRGIGVNDCVRAAAELAPRVLAHLGAAPA
jgi:oxygen-dependent protoporphyrinogen oxidase